MKVDPVWWISVFFKKKHEISLSLALPNPALSPMRRKRALGKT